MTVVQIGSAVPFDSNVYLVSGTCTALVDCGTGLDGSVCARVERALAGRRLDYLLLTHCHADHCGGAAEVAGRFGCRALIGAADAAPVESGDVVVTFADQLGVGFRPLRCEPVSEGDRIDLGGLTLEVMETPGHTAGSVCYYDASSAALFSGDTVFRSGCGRTDLPTGSDADMRRSLEKLRNVNIRTVYPGHGPVGDGPASVLGASGMLGGSE